MDASSNETFAYDTYAKKVESLRIKNYLLEGKIAQKELSYLNTLPVDSIWLKKFLQYAEILYSDPKTLLEPTIKAVYSRLSDAERNTETGKQISEFINLPSIAQIGGEMVDCELYDSADSLRRLSEFKGKYILLDFWTATCNPCIQSLPELKALEKEYKDRLTVISINMDPKEVWLEAIDKYKMTGEQWNDSKRDRKSSRAIYQVRAYPQYVLISPEGIIDQVWQGYAKASLDQRINPVGVD
ncbi:MAG: TlpA family protein disulfide reductase [Bacteroidales bacterium]